MAQQVLLCALVAVLVFTVHGHVVPSTLVTPSYQNLVPHTEAAYPFESVATPVQGNTTTLLSKRDISDEDYNLSIEKGAKYLCWLGAGSLGAPTPFWKQSDYDKLGQYGWVRQEREFKVNNQFQHAWEKLNFNSGSFYPSGSQGGSNYQVEWLHADASQITYKPPPSAQFPNPPARPYKRTLGRYMIDYNFDDNVLVVKAAYNPLWQAKGIMGFKGQVVPLRSFSDVTWLEYTHLAKEQGKDGDLSKLKYILIPEIENDVTVPIIKRVLKTRGGRVPRFEDDDGLFKLDSDEGKALLGSPNCSGMAWLLFQHTEQLGHKTITSIRVWDDIILDQQRGDLDKGVYNLMVYIDDFVA